MESPVAADVPQHGSRFRGFAASLVAMGPLALLLALALAHGLIRYSDGSRLGDPLLWGIVAVCGVAYTGIGLALLVLLPPDLDSHVLVGRFLHRMPVPALVLALAASVAALARLAVRLLADPTAPSPPLLRLLGHTDVVAGTALVSLFFSGLGLASRAWTGRRGSSVERAASTVSLLVATALALGSLLYVVNDA